MDGGQEEGPDPFADPFTFNNGPDRINIASNSINRPLEGSDDSFSDEDDLLSSPPASNDPSLGIGDMDNLTAQLEEATRLMEAEKARAEQRGKEAAGLETNLEMDREIMQLERAARDITSPSLSTSLGVQAVQADEITKLEFEIMERDELISTLRAQNESLAQADAEAHQQIATLTDRLAAKEQASWNTTRQMLERGDENDTNQSGNMTPIQAAIASQITPQTPETPIAEDQGTRGRKSSYTNMLRGATRVIGGAIKGTPPNKSVEDLQARVETLLVQKSTLMNMNRAKEQEVLEAKRHAAVVEETAAARLRKVARRNALAEEHQKKEVFEFMTQIQRLEEHNVALQAQAASSQGAQMSRKKEPPLVSSQALVQHLDISFARLPSHFEESGAAAHVWMVGYGDDDSAILVLNETPQDVHKSDVQASVKIAHAAARDLVNDMQAQLLATQREKVALTDRMERLKSQCGNESGALANLDQFNQFEERTQQLETQLAALRIERDNAVAASEGAAEVQCTLAEQNQLLQRRIWDLEQSGAHQNLV